MPYTEECGIMVSCYLRLFNAMDQKMFDPAAMMRCGSGVDWRRSRHL